MSATDAAEARERRAHVRHSWQRNGKHTKTCTRAGAQAQRHEHSGCSYTEWTLPGGETASNWWGGKTPPCDPAWHTET